ncbi:unnamed protein product, partial [Hermetia illucens]
MSHYPTEEEEFELMYNEELEMMDELNHYDNITRTEPQPCSSKSLTQSTLSSPHLSQIPHEAAGGGAPVNRRLFGTPAAAKRISSTPLPKSDSFEMAPLDPLTEIQNIGISRKRRLEDLFGDIRDIEKELELECNEAKKKKSEEERDLELIEKIVEARRRAREIHNPLKVDAVDRLNKIHSFNMQNLSSNVPKWPFIALSHNGMDRVYVRRHSEEHETKEINEVDTFNKGFGGLLGESKVSVWNEARELVVKRMTAPQITRPAVNAPLEVTRDDIAVGHDLWVEKYQPKKYIELLSDESTNRSLLYWLKMWDKVVFGREFNTIKADQSKLNTFNKKTGRFESTGGWKKRSKNMLNTDIDELGRPIQKIALLCGPPGLGKTTLAHTIARHAGYNVREINASDDRSPEAFRLALESGTQMTSVLNQDKRPNCIVLDEIDGAPLQSIEFLIKFCSDNVIQKGKKGTKTKKQILRRPIICICNDLYVPALRQLRQIAFVVNFPPLESSRLAERLYEIANCERFKTDMASLLALAEKSGNDVRSCLSMMQFFSASKKRLTLQDVLNSNLGQKDRHRGLFDVWSAIFQIQRPKKQITEMKINDKSSQVITMTDMSAGVRVQTVLEAVHSGGDYERLMQGVFENYLGQKMPDPNLSGIVQATKWFCFSDQIHRTINQHQDYTTYMYLQFGFVAWHLLFASLAWPKIHFPNKGFEIHQKTTTQRMIFHALRRGISPGVMGIGSGHAILLDTVSLMKRVLSPNLRSVSLQLLTPKERYDLTHTVEAMADLGLVFTQTKVADGTYQYQLEPDLDALCQFPGYLGITLSYFGRQLIAREVELEIMRRSAPKAEMAKKSEPSKKIVEKKKKEETSPQGLPNHLQTLKPKIRRGANVKET